MFIRAANICARTTLPVSNEVQTRTLSTSWVTATGILLVCRAEHSPIKQIDYDDSEESACKSGQFNLLCCSNIRQEPLNFIIAGLVGSSHSIMVQIVVILLWEGEVEIITST